MFKIIFGYILLFFSQIYFVLAEQISTPNTHNIKLEITKMRNNDGRMIISINGKNDTYGPLISVRPGDQVDLEIINDICTSKELESGDDVIKEYCDTSIHIHGLIPLANELDGVPYVTQEPIRSGTKEKFTFQIPIDSCGTFWYHSHSSVQYGDGLRGIFIVECDKMERLSNNVIHSLENTLSSLEVGKLRMIALATQGNLNSNTEIIQEEIIALSDYYNDWNLEIMRTKVLSENGGPDPRVLDSLINGNKYDNQIIGLQETTKYLKLRIINSGMSGTQLFHIKNHKMIIIETDGTLIEPYAIEVLSLAVGQRYTVIVPIERENKNPIHVINGCGKMMGYIFKNLWFVDTSTNDVSIDEWQDDIQSQYKKLGMATKNEMFKEYTPINEDNALSLFRNPSETLIFDYQYYRDEISKQKYGTGVYLINGDKTFQDYISNPIIIRMNQTQCIEIIINSIDHMRHPWHLHGHRFQVVSMGMGGEGPLYPSEKNSKAWSKYQDDTTYWEIQSQTRNAIPMVRDSINIPGNSFAVIRFIPNNPGKWVLHCHVEWHMVKGLGVVIDERDEAFIDQNNNVHNSNVSLPTTPLNVQADNLQRGANNRGFVLLVYISIMLIFDTVFYYVLCCE